MIGVGVGSADGDGETELAVPLLCFGPQAQRVRIISARQSEISSVFFISDTSQFSFASLILHQIFFFDNKNNLHSAFHS